MKHASYAILTENMKMSHEIPQSIPVPHEIKNKPAFVLKGPTKPAKELPSVMVEKGYEEEADAVMAASLLGAIGQGDKEALKAKKVEADPAHKRAMEDLEKLKKEQEAIGKRLVNTVYSKQEIAEDKPTALDAYQKLKYGNAIKMVLNRGLTRFSNMMAKIANSPESHDPTYEVLESWTEIGNKIADAEAYVSGVVPDAMQAARSKGLYERADVESSAAAASARIDSDIYKANHGEAGLMQEGTDEELMADIEEDRKRAMEAAIIKSGEKFLNREKVARKERNAAIDLNEDWQKGVVRNAEGDVINSQEKIKAPRVVSKRSFAGGVGDSTLAGTVNSSADVVRHFTPTEGVRSEPRTAEESSEGGSEFMKQKGAEVEKVRLNYPKAAEVWTEKSKEFGSMSPADIKSLSEILGEKNLSVSDLATAYVLNLAYAEKNINKNMKEKALASERIEKINVFLKKETTGVTPQGRGPSAKAVAKITEAKAKITKPINKSA